MANILAIDTSSAWCSVALSLGEQTPLLKHEPVTAGASQLLLPWVDSLLADAKLSLKEIDAIAVCVGPGAFTGVRLGVAAVQGLAISYDIPVIPVCSLDAIAAQLMHTESFKSKNPQRFVIAIDARMEEVYWATYEQALNRPKRVGTIHLSKPEELELEDVQFLAGSAIDVYRDRLPKFFGTLDADISITALGILENARHALKEGLTCNVRQLEPLYVRNKVALTTAERAEAFK